MAIEPEKMKKRIKIRVKEGEQVSAPEGYILNTQKSGKSKKVFDLLEGAKAKIKLKEGSESPAIPEGYVLDEAKSKPGKDVYVKRTTSTSVKPSEYQFREPTESEKESMLAGTFYGKNEAQYQNETPVVSEEKSELVVKRKTPKFKEEGPSYSGKEKREGRKAEREASRVEGKFRVGCPVGRGRISRAKY